MSGENIKESAVGQEAGSRHVRRKYAEVRVQCSGTDSVRER